MQGRSIDPLSGPVDAVMRLPGSKSITNRAMIAAAMGDGHSLLSNFLFADDTECLLRGLGCLGIGMTEDRSQCRVEITGCAGHLPESETEIDCRESGTMLRFCTALCATAVGDYRLHGRGRLHHRPLAPLIEALRHLGGRFEFIEQEGFAPLVVHGRGLRGGEVAVDGSLSSQFGSAILLAGPLAHDDILLAVTGTPVSGPYLELTCAVMADFDIAVITEDYRRIIVPAPQRYASRHYQIEPDASTAGYFLAAAALAGGSIRIEGLGRTSRQGDVGLLNILRDMGCDAELEDHAIAIHRDRQAPPLQGHIWDLGAMPDVVPTVAVVGLFAEGPTEIRNVAHLRYKESDRLTVLAEQLTRLGGDVQLYPDGLRLDPPRRVRGAEVDPAGDHRLAMALALAGLVVDGVTIRNSDCVRKSCPQFFELLATLKPR